MYRPTTIFKMKIIAKRLAELLAFAVCVETTVEIALAAAESELLPTVVIPYFPILMGVMTGIQSDLLLEGNELKANAERLRHWFSERSAPSELDATVLHNAQKAEEETLLTNAGVISGGAFQDFAKGQGIETDGETDNIAQAGCCKRTFFVAKKTYLSVGIISLWISLPIVPVAKFFLTYYQMQNLLMDKNVFELDKNLTTIVISFLSSFISAYYSFGTEGASAIEWLAEESTLPKFECCSAWLKNSLEKIVVGVAGKNKSIMLPAAVLGAINYGILQSLSLFQFLRGSFNCSQLLAACISIPLFLDMALQNFTFQGREFRKNAQTVTQHFSGSVILNENEESNPQPLTSGKRVTVILAGIFLIAIPTFLANYALTKFTIENGFQDYTGEATPHRWQLNCAIAGAVIAAVGEALTETVSAFDEIEEVTAKRLAN